MNAEEASAIRAILSAANRYEANALLAEVVQKYD